MRIAVSKSWCMANGFQSLVLEKGRGYPVGTVREWKGRKYIKTAPGKWKPKTDGGQPQAAEHVKLATKRDIDEANAECGKFEVSMEEMRNKPYEEIKKYANSRAVDFDGGIDKFIELMREKRPGISNREAGREFAKVVTRSVARKLVEQKVNGWLTVGNDGKLKFADGKEEALSADSVKQGALNDTEHVKLVNKLNGDVYENWKTDPAKFARYAKDGKATGLAVSKDIADIINSHNEASTLDWLDACADEISTKYPNIQADYVRENLRTLRIGYRNGKKEKVLLLPEHQDADSVKHWKVRIKAINSRTGNDKKRRELLAKDFAEAYGLSKEELDGIDGSRKDAGLTLAILLKRAARKGRNSDGWYSAMNDYDEAVEVYRQVVGDSMYDYHKKKADELRMTPNFAKDTVVPEGKQADNPKSKKVTARGLMSLNNKLWDKLGVESGSELRGDAGKFRKFLDAIKKELDKRGVSSASMKTFDRLEEDNYHTMNLALGLLGLYGDEVKDKMEGIAADTVKGWKKPTLKSLVNALKERIGAVRKSGEDSGNELEVFKKKVLEHLESLAGGEPVRKSRLVIEKGGRGLPVGTVREWKGQKYVKVAPGKWKPKYDTETKGARQTIAQLHKKVEACKSMDELLELIVANKDRFSDERGRPLPFVKELSDHVSRKHKELKGGKHEKAEKKEVSDSGADRKKEIARRLSSSRSARIDGSDAGDKRPAAKDSLTAEKDGDSRKKDGIAGIRGKYEASRSVTGNRKTLHVGEEKIKCHYKLVEADAPTASHDETTFRKTEGFPTVNGGSVNDNDYENSREAQESVMRIAGGYDGRALENPPVVTKDGIVVSGNNRTMSSKLAAKKGTDKAYVEELKETIEDYGIDEEELSKFKNPRLILEIDAEHEGEYTTEEFAKYNRSGKKEKSVTEKAVVIAKTVRPEAVADIAGKISEFETLGELYNDRSASEALINSFIQNGMIQPEEAAQYRDGNGLSANGKEFIETVLVGSVLNEGNIRALAGDGGKAIRQKLVRGIVPLIENKGHGNEYSFNGELNKAVEIAALVSKSHDTFPTMKDYLDQQDMFGEKPDPLTARLAELVHDSTQKAFAEAMREAEGGLRPAANGEMDMFLGGCESRDSTLQRILKFGKSVAKSLRVMVAEAWASVA